MSKKPHEDTRLAKYIERRVLELKARKSQLQIASEAGFPNANMITMIKNGSTKLLWTGCRAWLVLWSAIRHT